MTPQEHVQALADDLHCDLRQAEGLAGMMFVERGFIEGPVIHNQIDYFIILHELGHYAHGHTQGRPPFREKRFYFENGVLRSEAQAWEWALDHVAFGPIEDATRIFMWECLSSYYDGYLKMGNTPSRLWNGERFYVRFVYDAPGEYFGRVVRRIRGKTRGFKTPYPGTSREPSPEDLIHERVKDVLAAEMPAPVYPIPCPSRLSESSSSSPTACPS